jgi:hypothetical protein
MTKRTQIWVDGGKAGRDANRPTGASAADQGVRPTKRGLGCLRTKGGPNGGSEMTKRTQFRQALHGGKGK